MNKAYRTAVRIALTLALVVPVWATLPAVQATERLPDNLAAEVDRIVADLLDETGAPGVSIAVVRHGTIALTKAYGQARIEPSMPATSAMRYPIGSISKQFTAAAAVILAAEGRLDLDAPIARFFPDVTRSNEITLRQLLSHSSGISDYWPQDYVPPAMLEPLTTMELIKRFGEQPLDFEPGSKWQYSNTGYVIAGAIIEQAGGKPLLDLLQEQVFEPLGMESILDHDQNDLSETDPAGYQRFALGPLRRAPREGRGWLFAAGQLAMTAEDLAKWDVAMIEGGAPGRLVFAELTREVMLSNGTGTGYGLGVGVSLVGGRRRVRHGGEVSGFTATNLVYPEDRTAVVVLSNQDATDAHRRIAARLAELLLLDEAPGDREMLVRVGEVLKGLRSGEIDEALFTANGNAYFSEIALADIRGSLKKYGKPKKITMQSRSLRGGFTTRVYSAKYRKKTLRIVTRATADGKLEQLTFSVE